MPGVQGNKGLKGTALEVNMIKRTRLVLMDPLTHKEKG